MSRLSYTPTHPKANLLLSCLLSLFLPLRAAADINIDSLRIAYDYSEDVFERIDIQIQIADAYMRRHSLDTAIFEYTKAISLIPPDSAEYKAETLQRLSYAYHDNEDMTGMIHAQKTAINLYEKAGSAPRKVARAYSLLGRAYYAEARYDSAMVYYMDAKEIYEANQLYIEDYGYLLHFIGSVFKRQGDDEMACTYYHQEVEFGRKYKMKNIEAEGMYLAGICIESPRDAISNLQQCLSIYDELGNEKMKGLMYTLLSGNYSELDMPDSALYFQQMWVQSCRDRGERSHLAAGLSTMSAILIDMGRFNEADKYLAEALEVARTVGIKAYIRYWDIYENFYILNYERGNYKDAVEYQTLMYAYRDSAQNQQHQDAILEMEKIYNQEKQEAEHQQELAIREKESQLDKDAIAYQERMNRLLMIGGLVMLALGIFVFLKYRESQKQKKIISHQKKAMEFQKELVEAKNKDIIDSMVYASSIQKAIITSEEYIKGMFNDFFIFYKPRDIVSGDFYWAYETADGKKLIAVGDCTGHGVPGAMMSMLGTAFLNEIVIEGKEHQPKDVLNKLRTQVKRALHSQERRDGMDLSFCSIENGQLTFCGANLPLYVLRNRQLIEIKGNKQPVGYQPGEEKPFEEHVIQLEKDDRIYLFSDGYADQFGGPKGKKYKYKTFKDKLTDISAMTFHQQRKIIDDEFEIWKGDLEQLDDVCVLGFTV